MFCVINEIKVIMHSTHEQYSIDFLIYSRELQQTKSKSRLKHFVSYSAKIVVYHKTRVSFHTNSKRLQNTSAVVC